MGKTILVSAATVVATLLLLVGVAWAGNIFTVDRDGTVRLVVTDTGNVGVGTSSPGYKLTTVDTNAGTAGTAATYSEMTRETVVGTGGIFSAFRPFLKDAGTTAALSNQTIRAVYTRAGTGISSAFDSVITLVPRIDEGSGGTLISMQIEGPNVAATKTLTTWIGINVNQPEGAGTVTGKYAILTAPNAGNVGIAAVPAASAKLEIGGTDGALLIPRLTTAQRDALTPANGMIIYNTSTNAFNFYENGAWGTK